MLSVSGSERHSRPVATAVVPISNMYSPVKYWSYRSLGIGVVNVSARAGGILAPLVILLVSQPNHNSCCLYTTHCTHMQDQYFTGLYMLLMGTTAVATGLLCLSLPETLNTVLPATLRDLAY